MSELVALRQEMEQINLSIMKAVKAINHHQIVLNDRVSLLEEQMKKRVYVSPAHKNIIQSAVRNKVRAMTEKYCIDYKCGSKKLFQNIWRSIKDRYSISVYSELPDIEFDNALEFIRTWEDEVLLNRIKSGTVA